MPKIAIVAAMEREVAPLISGWRGWTVRTFDQGGHAGARYRLFEKENIALICGGIGPEAARRATEAVIQEVSPERVISVGFAGALDGSLRVGDVVMPRTVINAADGVRSDAGTGEGVLVSCPVVAGKDQKVRLAKAYGAILVDMEAAAVALGARARGIEFGVVKVISDRSDFDMPALDRFVAGDGTFRTVSFACHLALRPRLWGRAIALARNSSKASHALCGALMGYLEREAHGHKNLPGESLIASAAVDEFDSANGEEFAGAHTTATLRAHTKGKAPQ